MSDREAVFRELVATLEQRTSSATTDLFQTASKDLGNTKRIFYGGGSALVIILSTIGGWAMDTIEKMQRQAALIEAQSRKIDDLDTRVRLMVGRQRDIARRVLGNEVLIVDGLQWVADKIDAGRQSSGVGRPRSVNAAKTRIDDTGVGVGRLFELDGLEHE